MVPCALPLEEALDWSSFATLTDVYDLKNLGDQLECLRPKARKLHRTADDPHLQRPPIPSPGEGYAPRTPESVATAVIYHPLQQGACKL